MILLTVSEFRNNISKYLKMALTQEVAVKSPSGIFNISPNETIHTNPSPSGDPFWDNPKNLEHLHKAIAEAHKPGAKTSTWEELKERLSL